MKNNYTNTKSRFLLHFLLLVTTFLFYGNSWGQTLNNTTPGNYSWTCPLGVTSITIETRGGGGGGGGTTTSAGYGSGGAGGSYATHTMSVTPGVTYNYTVGATGTGGTSGGTGGTGGSSFFGNTTAGSSTGATILAVGGIGGNGSTAGAGTATGNTTGNVGTTFWAGGNGSAFSGTNSGAGGAGGGSTAVGGSASGTTAGTSALGGGTGGAGRMGNNAGFSGTAPGGGGGGGRNNAFIARAGGAGGAGQVKLTWTGYCVPLATNTGTYITNFTTTGGTTNINKTSVFSSGGYANYYATDAISIVAGTSFTGTVSMVPTASVSNGVSIFVDFNNNGVFTDSGEQVYTSASYQGSPWSTTSITIPALTVAGDYVMRVVIDYNATTPTSCSFSSGRGEMEDYKLTVTAPVTPTITSFTPSSGCSSTASVVITGTNFTGATGVTIGGTAVASYTVNSATQITATVGTGTTGTIAVTTGGGTATSAGTFTVNPTPTTVSLSASDASVCKNSVQTITATGGIISEVVISEDFNGVSPSFTQTNNSTGGVPANAVWSYANDGYNYSSNIFHSNDNSKFAISNSDAQGIVGTTATLFYSPIFSLVGYSSATLTFYQYFRYNSGETAKVQITTNGGGLWQDVATYTSTQGGLTSFALTTIDLTTYVGNATVQIRFKYDATYDWYWAIDNFVVKGDKQQVTWSPTTDLYTNAACTTPYTSGHATTVYAKPTATRTYTATSTQGSCSKTKTVTFTIENITYDNTLYSGNGGWSETPVSNKGLLFNDNYTVSSNITACSCTVNSGKNITVASGSSLILENELTVNPTSTMTFENNASLIQINDVVNSGNIVYNRTSPLTVGGSDYVYWSSPVGGQTVPAGQNYYWNYAAGTLGGWASAAGSTMGEGQGVIMRGVGSKVFTGEPFNGDVTVNIYRRGVAGLDDNWNLVGNPYPSAINANKFIGDLDNGNIIGTIALWTHGNPMSAGNAQPYYANYAYSYNPADYIYYNAGGSQTGPSTFNGNIAAGQSFFVQMVDGDGSISSSSVKFKNEMRTDAGAAYNNSQFYRNASTTDEKHRIWLDIVNSSSLSDRIMVGYISNATNDNDRLYDAARSTSTTGLRIYSLIGAEKMAIQGRSLPFDTNDIVPLAYNAPTTGNYSIAIHAVDGLFETQDVYLEDTQLNIVHDLKQAPYSFTVATVGENNTRFKIRYTSSTLGDEDFDSTDNVFIATKNALKVFSTAEQIESISVFDLLGRTIYNKNKINANEFTIPVERVNAPLIVKVKLTNGVVVDRKVLF